LKALHRYNAACAAAQAGCGQGKDGDKVDDGERARLRQQALDWLRADLVLRGKQAEGTPQARAVVLKTLQHWRTDPDLLGVRDESALARLPAEEQSGWRKLWADVAKLAGCPLARERASVRDTELSLSRGVWRAGHIAQRMSV